MTGKRREKTDSATVAPPCHRSRNRHRWRDGIPAAHRQWRSRSRGTLVLLAGALDCLLLSLQGGTKEPDVANGATAPAARRWMGWFQPPPSWMGRRRAGSHHGRRGIIRDDALAASSPSSPPVTGARFPSARLTGYSSVTVAQQLLLLLLLRLHCRRTIAASERWHSWTS